MGTECDNQKPRTDLLKRMLEQYPSEVTEEERVIGSVTKLRFMRLRDKETTISNLGYRIDGIAGSRRPKTAWEEELQAIKDQEAACASFNNFIDSATDDEGFSPNDGNPIDLVTKMIEQLRGIRGAFDQSAFVSRHECIGSSLLLVADAFSNVGVFWIDFGKTRLLPEESQLSHDKDWDPLLEPDSREDGIKIG